MAWQIVFCDDAEGVIKVDIDYGGKEPVREHIRVEDYPSKDDIIARIEALEAHHVENHQARKKANAIPDEIKALAAEYAASKVPPAPPPPPPDPEVIAGLT